MIPPISALDLVFAQGFELGYLSTIVIPSEQIRTFSLITAHDDFTNWPKRDTNEFEMCPGEWQADDGDRKQDR